jgi:hypothetical protein
VVPDDERSAIAADESAGRRVMAGTVRLGVIAARVRVSAGRRRSCDSVSRRGTAPQRFNVSPQSTTASVLVILRPDCARACRKVRRRPIRAKRLAAFGDSSNRLDGRIGFRLQWPLQGLSLPALKIVRHQTLTSANRVLDQHVVTASWPLSSTSRPSFHSAQRSRAVFGLHIARGT